MNKDILIIMIIDLIGETTGMTGTVPETEIVVIETMTDIDPVLIDMIGTIAGGIVTINGIDTEACLTF